MISIKQLISHRFRGFSEHENTIDGLNAALSAGVINLEFDIRVARCGTPMIYHDEKAKDARGRWHFLSDIMAHDYTALGGTFAHMPTAEALFKAAATHTNTQSHFLVDIKDAGFETEIHALVALNGLQSRVTYVSWVPEALYAIAKVAPDIPLCLSHWCQSPNRSTRKVHKVFEAVNGHVPNSGRTYVHGERSGWYVQGPLKGELKALIKNSGGSVCVPQGMVTAELVKAYHRDNIKVSTFSYVDWPHIMSHKKQMNIDLYFIDNKDVFDDL